MTSYDITFLIIQEENARRKLEQSLEYQAPAVLHIEDHEEPEMEKEEKSDRGVVVIDI